MVQNHHFVVMEEGDIHLRSYDFDGILGLGLVSFLVGRQNTSEYTYVPMFIFHQPTPVFKNIVKQELTSLNVFSFYYER
jgi:Eukaryotic aspartyl protease.